MRKPEIKDLKNMVAEAGHNDLVDDKVPVELDASLDPKVKGVCKAKVNVDENGKEKVDPASVTIALNPNNHEDDADMAGTLGHELKHAAQFFGPDYDGSKKQQYEAEADQVGDNVIAFVNNGWGRGQRAA